MWFIIAFLLSFLLLGQQITYADSCPTKGCAEKYLLSLSWQSAFCETHPNKIECMAQTENGYDASNFTLHGLWPDKLAYCGVSRDDINNDETKNWAALPVVEVDTETSSELIEVMPGVVSNLEFLILYINKLKP